MVLDKKKCLFFCWIIIVFSFVYPFLNSFYLINPVESILHYSGQSSIRFLLLTLSITPLIKFLKQPFLIFARKMFGLTSFFYALFHFLVYLFFEIESFGIYEDFQSRPFIAYGFFAFFCLIPLAVTSSSKSIKKMGVNNWKNLHQLIYPAFAFSAFHYYLKSVSKEGPKLALTYLFFGLFLLFFRAFKLNFRSRIND